MTFTRTRGSRRSPKRTPSTSSAARSRWRQMWRGSRARHMLAVDGPSGAGKTSFLQGRAASSRPAGLGILAALPGIAPFYGLGWRCSDAIEGDPRIQELLLTSTIRSSHRRPVRWRRVTTRPTGRRPIRGALHPQPTRSPTAICRAVGQSGTRSRCSRASKPA